MKENNIDEKVLQHSIDRIDYMLINHKYTWANDTLLSIKNYADKNGYLTDNQMRAVDNIYNSKGAN